MPNSSQTTMVVDSFFEEAEDLVLARFARFEWKWFCWAAEKLAWAARGGSRWSAPVQVLLAVELVVMRAEGWNE